jgi:iron(II)-dependent oxidoreductase
MWVGLSGVASDSQDRVASSIRLARRTRGRGGDSMNTLTSVVEDALARARAETLRIVEPLDEEMLSRRADDCLGPILWDLGHIAYFEELWIAGALGGDEKLDPRFDRFFDALASPRCERESLPLPSFEDTLRYMSMVRERTLELLDTTEGDPSLLRDRFVFGLVVQHEQQHQETILQSLDLPTRDDVYPVPNGTAMRNVAMRAVDDTARVEIGGGGSEIGTDRWGGVYDNERPRHAVALAPFVLDRFPVTVRRFREFVADGGYREPTLWCDEGWAWLESSGVRAPQGWTSPDGDAVRRFGTISALGDDEPVQHVNWFEADAFARWDGGRLPTETEWEAAAGSPGGSSIERSRPWGEAPAGPPFANVGREGAWAPHPVGSYPLGASPAGVEQLVGDVYEWTSSVFDGYPGFAPYPYPEYSIPFFDEGYRVLRGASWAAGASLARSTYRNWDLPERRQIFAGLRVARDA